MSRKRKKELCIYCNHNCSTAEGDHIPPRSFFRQPRGFELIQVPCCLSCNNEYGRIDEMARNLIVMLEPSQKHSSVRDELIHTALRSLNNNERNDGKRRQFIEESMDIEAIRLYFQTHPAIPPDKITDDELEDIPMHLVAKDDFRKFIRLTLPCNLLQE